MKQMHAAMTSLVRPHTTASYGTTSMHIRARTILLLLQFSVDTAAFRVGRGRLRPSLFVSKSRNLPVIHPVIGRSSGYTLGQNDSHTKKILRKIQNPVTSKLRAITGLWTSIFRPP